MPVGPGDFQRVVPRKSQTHGSDCLRNRGGIENPFAGRYVEDLTPLIEISEELGELLAQRCIAALGIPGGKAEGYAYAATDEGVAYCWRGEDGMEQWTARLGARGSVTGLDCNPERSKGRIAARAKGRKS